MKAMAPTRSLHVVAMESGLDRAAELVPAARRAGRTVVGHVLRPPLPGEPDAARLGDELALLRTAARECLDDEGVLLLADERGALVVPEVMRVLLDERGLGWDDAWARVGASTIARFGSPKSEPGRPFWTISFLEAADPRLLEIVYEINRRHLDAVEARWPGDLRSPSAPVDRPRGRPEAAAARVCSRSSPHGGPTWRRRGTARPARSSPTSPSSAAARSTPVPRRCSCARGSTTRTPSWGGC